MSPRMVLRKRTAHCMEGAMLAALALRVHGHKPWILDLTAAANDDDHVVALFKVRGCYGAISKTNHAVLRYREPIYRTVRELALSYFHEYFLHDGKKTLLSFAGPIDLARFDPPERSVLNGRGRRGWMTSEEDVFYVPQAIDRMKHTPFLTKAQRRGLRRADTIEREAGKFIEWERSGKKIL